MISTRIKGVDNVKKENSNLIFAHDPDDPTIVISAEGMIGRSF